MPLYGRGQEVVRQSYSIVIRERADRQAARVEDRYRPRTDVPLDHSEHPGEDLRPPAQARDERLAGAVAQLIRRVTVRRRDERWEDVGEARRKVIRKVLRKSQTAQSAHVHALGYTCGLRPYAAATAAERRAGPPRPSGAALAPDSVL